MPRFPMPMAYGWYAVAWSDDLAPGDVQALRYFDTDLVLFRTESGEACVVDAFCPHLGAHLGHGGSVVGESLRCPFHAWRFGTAGECVEVPYAKRIPPTAKLAVWKSVERNRMIWVWFHPRGEDPLWEVMEIPETTDPGWSDYRRHRWTIRTHSQEPAENGVDSAHFRTVHGTKNVPESEVVFDGIERRSVQHARMETPRGVVDGKISVMGRGIGFATTRFTGICETLLLNTPTPIDAETLDVRFSFTQPLVDGKEPKGGVAAAIIKDIVKQMNEDIPIWENKAYVSQPLLCDGDGPIAEYRRWIQQFYVEPGA